MYSNRTLGLNSHRSRPNSNVQPVTAPVAVTQPNIHPKPNSVTNYQAPIYQSIQSQPIYQPLTGLNKYSHRPDSSRVTNPNSLGSVYQPPIQNPDLFFIQKNPMIHSSIPQFHSNVNPNPINHLISYPYTQTIPITQPSLNIGPLKPSNIDQTRPARNIFPVDSYVNRTKFD